MAHYVMVGEGPYPAAPIAVSPDLPGTWMLGRKLTMKVPTPLHYELDPNRPGNPAVLYDEKSIPIMRDDLVDALQHAGVDNLELFDAVVSDPNTGQSYTNYKAFNVLGLVACADMGASEFMGTSESEMLDVDFDALVIDEKKAGDLLLFRLAENISAIIVDDTVRQEVEKRKIPGIVFYASGEWSG